MPTDLVTPQDPTLVEVAKFSPLAAALLRAWDNERTERGELHLGDAIRMDTARMRLANTPSVEVSL